MVKTREEKLRAAHPSPGGSDVSGSIMLRNEPLRAQKLRVVTSLAKNLDSMTNTDTATHKLL